MSEQTESSGGFSIDESSDFGARAAGHLREDPVVWLTTVSPSGVPSPNLVWFLWDGASTVRVFSMPSAARIKHLGNHSQLSLNFAGDGQGGDIVVLSGRAAVDEGAPSVADDEAYVAKYRPHIARLGLTPEQFGLRYSVSVVIELTRLRGH
jgi:PPOX class probable F420-dependent enzyme